MFNALLTDRRAVDALLLIYRRLDTITLDLPYYSHVFVLINMVILFFRLFIFILPISNPFYL